MHSTPYLLIWSLGAPLVPLGVPYLSYSHISTGENKRTAHRGFRRTLSTPKVLSSEGCRPVLVAALRMRVAVLLPLCSLERGPLFQASDMHFVPWLSLGAALYPVL